MGFRKLDNFLRNLKFLASHNLERHLSASLDSYKYELEDVVLPRPEILDAESAIDRLVRTGDSFVRYGDGELAIMMGRSVGFQRFDPRLAERLCEILAADRDRVMVGIPRYWFYYSEALLDSAKHYFRAWVARHRAAFLERLNLSKRYYDACASCMYATYRDYDFHAHYGKVRDIWRDKKVTVVCGRTVFDKIRPDIFDSASDVAYLHAPSLHAYAQYDDILARSLQIPEDRLLVLILGPTATVLACDLAEAGRRALDLGHIAKDYVYFRDGVARDRESAGRFYEPD